MFKQAQKVVAGVAVLAAVAIGAAAVAGAASNKGSGSSTTPQAPQRQGAPPRGIPPGGHGPGEKLLTGSTADKVKKAAEAKVPGGKILRVETDSDGSPYEAHVQKSNGSQVVVKVDKDFKATSVDDFPGPRGGPPGGGSGPA
ncbi:MAG TPA: hypothetical protein VGF21_09680 [Thermoleophilaceae bacterium]